MDRLLQSETTNTTDGCEWKLKVWLWNRWCEVLKCVCGVSLLSGPQQQHSLWIIQSVLSQQLSAHFISVWTGFSQQPRRTRRLLSVSRTLRTLKLDPLFICQQEQRRVKSWSKQKPRARKSARVQLLPGALRTYSSRTRSSSAEFSCTTVSLWTGLHQHAAEKKSDSCLTLMQNLLFSVQQDFSSYHKVFILKKLGTVIRSDWFWVT